jgi:hypothetical protein
MVNLTRFVTYRLNLPGLNKQPGVVTALDVAARKSLASPPHAQDQLCTLPF